MGVYAYLLAQVGEDLAGPRGFLGGPVYFFQFFNR